MRQRSKHVSSLPPFDLTKTSTEVMQARQSASFPNIKPSLQSPPTGFGGFGCKREPRPRLWQFQREVRAGSREFLIREGWEDFREEKQLSAGIFPEASKKSRPVAC
jgi:hypothetical protein